MSQVVLAHGERYGDLTVLKPYKRKGRTDHYRVGCKCGWTKDHYGPRKLLRGLVTKCSRCRGEQSACKDSVSK